MHKNKLLRLIPNLVELNQLEIVENFKGNALGEFGSKGCFRIG